MAIYSHLLQRDCTPDSTNADCKPTSKVLIDVVPAVIMGFIIFVALIVLFVLSRRARRLERQEDAKGRESIEIDVYDPPPRSFAGNRAQSPFDSTISIPSQQSANRRSELSVPPAARSPSPSPRSFDTEFDRGPYRHAPPGPAKNATEEFSAESIAQMAQKERHIV